MGSTWVLICSTALVLVLQSSASRGHNITQQRAVTFEIAELIPEMEPSEAFPMQKEVDWSYFFNPEEFPTEQVMVSPPQPPLKETGQPSFRPRSFSGLPVPSYHVQFPLGRPTSGNLQAICDHSDHRPRYPPSFFPVSGFGVDKLRAAAVNDAEAWLSTCCKGIQMWEREVTLCCATQAWEWSVKKYCEEDLSIKHPWYPCCKLTDNNSRLKCFSDDAPNPNYGPTEELPVQPLPSTTEFNFHQNACPRTQVTLYRSRANRRKKVKKSSAPPKTDISFPPGRPTTDTIESVCRNQKLRPLYAIKSLPGSGIKMLARQAKAINRIEKGFKQCCKNKKSALNCADQKWHEELNKFCLAENGGQVNYPCCSEQSDQYSCFQQMSPDPYYNVTSAPEVLSLSKICDTHKIIKKRFPVGFPLKGFVTQCCPLSEQEKTACFTRLLQEMSQKLCVSRKATPTTVRRCCKLPSQETPECISKILMDALTKATNFLSQKKRKRCLIS